MLRSSLPPWERAGSARCHRVVAALDEAVFAWRANRRAKWPKVESPITAREQDIDRFVAAYRSTAGRGDASPTSRWRVHLSRKRGTSTRKGPIGHGDFGRDLRDDSEG